MIIITILLKAVLGVKLLIISKIKYVKNAVGLDNFGTEGFQALGAIIGRRATVFIEESTVVGKDGVAIGTVLVTIGLVAKAEATGGSIALAAFKYLNKNFSGQDDLIVKVNGERDIQQRKKSEEKFAQSVKL